MGCRGRPFFDLNEPPAEEDEETDGVLCLQPQKALPSLNSHASDLFSSSEGSQRILNNHAFSHASSVSGFQPFVRPKHVNSSENDVKQKKVDDLNSMNASSTYGEETKTTSPLAAGPADSQGVEREEGEWSDAEGSADAFGMNSDNDKREQSINVNGENAETQELAEKTDLSVTNKASESISCDSQLPQGDKDEFTNIIKDENWSYASSGLDLESSEKMGNNSRHLEANAKGDTNIDGLEELSLVVNKKEVKGIEASHALKCANNPGKRHKLDQHKEAMLGKKRSRQTMFLNLEDVKQAAHIKTSTPRRQTISSPLTARTVKEIRNIPAPAECSVERTGKDQKQGDASFDEGGTLMNIGDQKSESNGDTGQGSQAKSRRLNSVEILAEVHQPPILRQSSWKQPLESRQLKNPLVPARKQAVPNQNSMDLKLGNKKHLPSKKQTANSTQSQDTSVERLLREVTNEKFWHHPEEAELQCVPGRFESMEEYVRVFEPLLFEECRAQLYSTWEEQTETVSSYAHVMVRIKNVERRERGWYDVIVLPMHEFKWTFKEGDVAVLSSPKPGTVRFRRNQPGASEDDVEAGVTGRVAGTVRRHIPIDTRDPPGAILHFYVGDTFDPNSNDDHILKKFHPKGIWFLTVLGSLATTQREYIALHAFRRLNLQMQTAILKPSPEQFPKYEEQPPAMPECFTQNFVEYLHRTFNGPQLAAIQWAGTHTAAGTSSGMTKRQDPWPFTLVQGPPGTGKTHTVWGMLNVIHLVQYQHYYTALLKKLAPESYKHANESNSESVSTGSIDEVLQSMDQNLFRTLPKLCPKPRMLVCAPSNAATDELLARVLDRGFIDGEMKVYRPDVARVGVDSQTRAAQAVSVERRTEQLLVKSREEVIGWMQQLRVREAEYSRQIAYLQRELNVAAAAGRAQGSVGVDPDVLVARDQSRDALLQNLAAAVEARDKNLVELSRLLILEARFRAGSSFNLEEARGHLEASFANEAEIVFTTVSSSGRKLFSRLTHGFDMVVIDEAAQASEVAVLPPLSLGAARCVLVGDPQQLPATVISKAAGTLLYSRSLFERFQQAGCPTMLLSVQYRMHPQIRDFPSRYFYQGRLTDSESVAKLPDEPYYKDQLLRPYVFYDITHGRESHRGGSVSYQNIHEAQFCLRIYEHLQKTLKSLGVGKISVGIITPYKLQLKCLQREFEEVLNSEEGKDLYINTVDAFQGQERDVIIMSCVRASNHGVGFVSDIRRMNVALTRARRALWVMGNANALIQSDDWAALINDAKARSCYADMESLPKDFLVSKGPPYTPLPGKASSNMRGLRTVGPRHRHLDMQSDSRSGTPSEDEGKLNISSLSRNGGHRDMKLPAEKSLDDFNQSGEKSRDSWHNGFQNKQSSAGLVGKRDS
ncbi:probable helicase senataxin [Macadamia integrifolia]|uniref:probable helicase senataxin n=1 Tax=Macadamia integrifolia TaxID=60698 RepID=UPI001C4F720D|nr:probable helicase senataxin [Macadamia integrifolia]XP_042514273.1 probable helicase senataxin [Macadamia integrifolia]